MNSLSLSDRERTGLRGPVKTIVDEWSTTVFDREGKILEWRGNTWHGPSERTYSYDEDGRLIRIAGSNNDQVDEFRYDEQGRKIQIRHVPAQPKGGPKATGISICFEAAAEGHTLNDGGTVETTYNEHGNPLEMRIVDNQGILLCRIMDLYDTNGRLAEERLINENFAFPKSFLDEIPGEQRAEVLAEVNKKFESMSRQTGLFGNAERTYVYDDQGRVAERHMRMGPIREDLTWSYNNHGDISEWSSQTNGFTHDLAEHSELRLSCHYIYEYDESGNWTSRSQISEVGGKATTHTLVRQLTYHH